MGDDVEDKKEASVVEKTRGDVVLKPVLENGISSEHVRDLSILTVG